MYKLSNIDLLSSLNYLAISYMHHLSIIIYFAIKG